MRARLLPASLATLLLIALASPALPPVTSHGAAAGPFVAASGRAMPMARKIAREPVESFVGFADSATLSGDLASAVVAASRAQPILPTPTPAPTRPPAVAVAPAPIVGDADAELHMLALINASRAAGGLVPLTMDERAAAAARSHSAVESRSGYVYHDGPDGTAGSRDVPACGSGWYGENTGKIWRGNVDALHIEFMSEPWVPINHRTNIMDPAFRRVGIGAVEGHDALYMTMVFCR